MSAVDYILKFSVLALLGAYLLLHKQHKRELERPVAPLPRDWTGKTVDARPLFAAMENARRHYLPARHAPYHQAHYKRALLALARVSVEKLNFFNSLRPDHH